MTISKPAMRNGHHLLHNPWNGPRATFLATFAAVGVLMAAGLIPNNLLMPAIATLLFVLAATFALIAWGQRSTDEGDVTYWDVAGAVTLIGICTTALIDPDQMVRIVEGAYSEN
jgi:hypothetical protein